MQNVDRQWDVASLQSKQRFQSVLFPRGLVYDYTNHRFGTSEISRLYRLVENKKGSEEPSKSFLVAQVALHWNHICKEILAWRHFIEELPQSVTIPARH